MTVNSSTYSSSNPSALVQGFGSGMPRVFVAQTTAVSSAIIATGFWAGCGAGGRAGYQAGMTLGDLLLHTQVTTAAVPVKATLHVVTASTANGSTSAASAFNALAYDVTVATAT